MKIFLSAVQNNLRTEELIGNCKPMKWNLMSYYYIRNSNPKIVQSVIDNSELIEIDSGAHSFQKGKKVDWDNFTREYAEWIKQNDCDKIIGYFEMDVDNVIGYEKVLELRKILEDVTDKVIPVWHRNRGIAEYRKMCEQYSGKIVAVSGFQNEDIQDDQYIDFLKVAWSYGCELHCLGMTRKKILDTVPFDYVDSSSWIHEAIYGRISNRKLKNPVKHGGGETLRKKQTVVAYKNGKRMQEYYFRRWSLPTLKLKEKFKK